MILKIVTFEETKDKTGVKEVANFVDGITHASVFFSEATNCPAVRCTIGNADVTFDVPFSAYLMNDNGKTIQKISKSQNIREENELIKDLHDAIDIATEHSKITRSNRSHMPQ